jgi:hypothetical protein
LWRCFARSASWAIELHETDAIARSASGDSCSHPRREQAHSRFCAQVRCPHRGAGASSCTGASCPTRRPFRSEWLHGIEGVASEQGRHEGCQLGTRTRACRPQRRAPASGLRLRGRRGDMRRRNSGIGRRCSRPAAYQPAAPVTQTTVEQLWPGCTTAERVTRSGGWASRKKCRGKGPDLIRRGDEQLECACHRSA